MLFMRGHYQVGREARIKLLRCAASVLLLIVVCTVQAGCTVDERLPQSNLFPPQVGEYLRTSGPVTDSETGVDLANYSGPDGVAVLRVKLVGKDQVSHALSQLPPGATDVQIDPEQGTRVGTFFTYGGEFHAAWGNGDWVLIVSAPTAAMRSTFLANYGH